LIANQRGTFFHSVKHQQVYQTLLFKGHSTRSLSSGCEHGAAAGPQERRGNFNAAENFRIEIVQKADTSCLFDELDAALQSGSSEKRLAMLRQVTDLFLIEADRLSEEQIGIFDVVLVQLIERIEARTLMEISERLAPVANAPTDLTLSLAGHSEIAIARPVLANSCRLSTTDLVEIAKTQGHGHLLAISERAQIEPAVTDVLLDRGNQVVVRSVAGNSGAKFSQNGFAALVKAAEDDDRLAEATGLRLDLPLNLLRQLLSRASEAVRSRLLARTPPEFQEEIRQALSAATAAVDRESSKPRDFHKARVFVKLLQDKGDLHESTLCEFARTRKFEETAVALSLLSSASLDIIKPLMTSPMDDGLLIPCKVADCRWETVSAILATKLPPGSAPKAGHEHLKTEFGKLSKTNAERLLRFWQIREASARSA
jgi:uncharacterized protein (DUF2336 family)